MKLVEVRPPCRLLLVAATLDPAAAVEAAPQHHSADAELHTKHQQRAAVQ